MDYEIRHWGIKDQKWGRRRYQNPDGSYTEEGKARRRKDYVPYDQWSDDAKQYHDLLNRDVKTMSNAEIDAFTNRSTKLKNYNDSMPKSNIAAKIALGIAAADLVIKVLDKSVAVYNSSDKFVQTGKKFINEYVKK